jgi:hypothetical protein
VTVDRCDFQVPPSVTGWYGILSQDMVGSVLHQAAYWTGRDWREYPVRAYTRSIGTFPTKKAALAWACALRDRL